MARPYLVGFAVVTPRDDKEAIKAIRQAVGAALTLTASPRNVKPVALSATAAGFMETQGLVLVKGYQYQGNPVEGEKMAKASLLAGRAKSERCLIAVAYCLADSHKDGHVVMTCGPREQILKLPKAEIVSTGEATLPFMHKLLLAGLRQTQPEILVDVFPQGRAAQLDNTLPGQAPISLPRKRF